LEHCTFYGNSRRSLGGAGTAQAGLAFGGNTGSVTGATEEYNSNINAITPAAWASGGNLPTNNSYQASAGIQTAALGMGGYNPPSPTTTTTVEYDGTAWSGGGTLNTARQTAIGGGFGTQTAASISAGYPPRQATENYDGTSWAASGNLGTARYAAASAGTQIAGLLFGGNGDTPTDRSKTEEYDGTSWSASNDLNSDQAYFAGAGTQTAGLSFAGQVSPTPGFSKQTEEYDGTSWTVGNNMGTARYQLAGGGTQTSAMAMGGLNPGLSPSRTVFAEQYDGTVWSNTANLATGRQGNAGTGPGTAGLTFGGYNGTASISNTEEFTGEIQTATASTLTTS
jgi:hypothetical protein